MLVSKNEDSCKRVKVLLNDAVLVYSADAVNPAAFIQVTDHCLRQFAGFGGRCITVIQENIERDWEPILQVPSFPECISGHGGISAAAATILSKQYGSNVACMDTTEMQYLGMCRFYLSVNDAAAEVSISRMNGGIHYKAAV